MKKLVAISLFILSINLGFSQEKITYSEVIEVDSASTKDLYYRALSWSNKTFKSSKDVIQISSPELGELSGKALFSYDSGIFFGSTETKGTVKYSFSIYLKDGRYKYEITDFVHDSYGMYNFGLITTSELCPNVKANNAKWSTKVWNDIKSQIETNAQLIITSLKLDMEKQPESKNDDW